VDKFVENVPRRVHPIHKGKRKANDVPNRTGTETDSKKAKKSTKVHPHVAGVINVDELDFPPQPLTIHLFVFPESLSGEEKLDVLMSSKFATEDKYSNEIAFYADVDNNDFPIVYKDFQKFRDKKFMTTSVVSGFFKLLEKYFVPFMNHQRFADCSFWANYFSKPNERTPEKLTVAIYKYFKVGKDKHL